MPAERLHGATRTGENDRGRRPGGRLGLALALAVALVLACSPSEPRLSLPTTSTAGGAQATTPVGAGEIVVDLSARRQVIDGFGASMRVWDDPHLSDAPSSEVPEPVQEEILDALVEDLGLTRFRPVLGRGVEPENDNSDPHFADPSGFNFSGKRADRHIEVVAELADRGVDTFFPAPINLEPWMDEEDPEEYVEWAMAMLEHWRDRGAEPPFFSPLNEPATNRAGNRSAEWLVEVVSLLGERMDAAGLRTKLVIPDDLNPAEAHARAAAVLADPRARDHVGALAYHLYARNWHEGIEPFLELAQAHDLPVWMTEFSTRDYGSWPGVLGWAEAVHALLTTGGASAVDYMWGFFGNQEQPHTLVSMEMKQGRYRSHAPTPAYFVTGQWSRFVRPGYVRVDARSSREQILASAFTGPDGEVVVVAVNPGGSDERMALAMLTGAFSGPVRAVRTSATERWAEVEVEPEGPRVDVVLPSRSVTTFVGDLGASS